MMKPISNSPTVRNDDVEPGFRHVGVAVALPVFPLYTYAVSAAMGTADLTGKRVLVPFGRQRVTGFVVGPAAPDDRFEIKQILDVLDDQPLLAPPLIELLRWAADYYLYPLGEVIKQAVPSSLVMAERVHLSITPAGLRELQRKDLPGHQRTLLERLRRRPCQQKQLGNQAGRDIPYALINKMAAAGLIAKTVSMKGCITAEKTETVVSATTKALPQDRFYDRRREIIDFVSAEGEVAMTALRQTLPDSAGLLPYLVNNGFLNVREKTVFRDPLGRAILPDQPPRLTAEQGAAVDSVAAALGNGFAAFLLSGVTGSGKTEVYLRIAALGMKKGLGVLVLVPEIALISQTVGRFRARFGDKVAVLHSGLSSGEKYDQWDRIRRGDAPVVIGARSAIFAPLHPVGIIIVDEEHDNSYKQENRFRYNARDLAVVRAKMSDGIVMLGSATPSLQSLYNVRQNKFKELRLTHRINRRPLPEITVVDLCRQRDQRGARRFLSPELRTALEQTLARGEQALLFLNRRGYANFPVCRGCGEPLLCKNCNITMTLHKTANAYRCHFCGFTRASDVGCDTCGHPELNVLGTGTEKVEEAVTALFPEARVARLDRDTTRRKGTLISILKALRNRRIDILVGTQMVAKGHDFPFITLVGIVCADLSLSFPDFRSSEQTFQLLAQVAGRAGRGEQAGRVVLQTYTPDHFSIQAARVQDYQRFYDTEISFRRALKYPPVSRLIQLGISGRDSRRTGQYAHRIGDLCQRQRLDRSAYAEQIDILGPVEAPLTKVGGYYRWQILLKCTRAGVLHQYVRQIIAADAEQGKRHPDVRLAIDVDPVYML